MAKWMEEWNWPKVVAFGLAIAGIATLVVLFGDRIPIAFDFVVSLVREAKGGG